VALAVVAEAVLVDKMRLVRQEQLTQAVAVAVLPVEALAVVTAVLELLL
jgi:hypothetical protein